MSNTTFSGPIKAGTISNTVGTTLGSDVKNTGFVLMSQTEAVDQTATTSTTSIIIPAKSQLVTASLLVSVVWNGAAATAGLGYVGDATAFTAALAFTGVAIGIIPITAGANKARLDAWADVGDTDRRLLLTYNNTGTGDGWLTVTYMQAVDVG
jgi:hypothetical protein